jgi:hypothetical protein
MQKMKFSLVSILLTIGLVSVLQAQSRDYNAEFSLNSNPNGVWSYGSYVGGFGGVYTLYGGPTYAAVIGFWGTDPTGSVSINTDPLNAWNPGWPNGMYWNPGGTNLMTPQSGGVDKPAARFTAPAEGTYSVTAEFENLSSAGGPTTAVFVLVNGAIVHEDTVTGFKSGPENFSTFLGSFALATGETIDFAVGAIAGQGSSNGGWQQVGFECTIQSGELPPPTMNLVMQLDAGLGTIDPNKPGGITYGDTVRIWEDQSASGILDATTQWGSPSLESGTFPNGPHNVIRFTGGDGMTIYKPSSSDPNYMAPLDLSTYTIYVVGKLNTTLNTSQIFFANYANGKGYSVGVSDVLPDYAKFWTNAGGEMRSTGPIDDNNRYYLIATTVTQTRNKMMFVNDCMEAEGNGGSVYSTASAASVGALGNGTQYLKGDIAEIRVYDGFIESTHLAVVNELSNKYGLNRECLGGPNPDQVALTALTFYGTSSSGFVRPQERWNTQYSDTAWDVILTSSSIEDLQSLVLDPNDSFPSSLNIENNLNIYEILNKGQEYTYTWLNARIAADQGLYFGMNFFFDSAEKLSRPHGISVYANMYDVADTEQPEFLADSATTMGWPITDVPGAGTLIYKDFDKGLAVTLTDWVVYHQDVFSLDLISNQEPGGLNPITNGPDGNLEVVGQFTLSVSSYTPTCDDLIAMGDEYLFMDFNQDCYVNLEDFAQFAQDWLKCNDPANANCID